jgi:hypothetical protein
MASGVAPARGETPPEPVAETIAEAAEICRAAGGKPDTAAILSGEDLNGDGDNDWIADFARLKCDGASNPACNPNGCMLQLYFGIGEGWDLVFEDFAKSYKFSSSGTTHTMHVTTSGLPCNKPAEETCSYNYRLEKDAVRPAQ